MGGGTLGEVTEAVLAIARDVRLRYDEEAAYPRTLKAVEDLEDAMLAESDAVRRRRGKKRCVPESPREQRRCLQKALLYQKVCRREAERRLQEAESTKISGVCRLMWMVRVGLFHPLASSRQVCQRVRSLMMD